MVQFHFMVQLYRAHCVIFTFIRSKRVPSTLVLLSFEPEIASHVQMLKSSEDTEVYDRKHVSAKRDIGSNLLAQKRMYVGAGFTVNKQTFQSYFMVITARAKLRNISYRVMLIYGTNLSSPEPSLITGPHFSSNFYHTVHFIINICCRSKDNDPCLKLHNFSM